MSDQSPHLPRYRGEKWIRSGLPKRGIPWLWSTGQGHGAKSRALRDSLQHVSWKWPRRPVFFLTDPHADAEAFVASLVASGGVKKTGPANDDLRLTKAGRQGRFIIGGDCLDKGPSNLAILRTVRAFIDRGARVTLLAGNHDLRLWVGLRALDMKDEARTEHFFLRLGPKVVPLLKEVYELYLVGDRSSLRDIPGERQCRRKLYPSKRWFREFPEVAEGTLSDAAVDRELTRMRKKGVLFAKHCARADLSMRKAYAAALKCRELLLEPDGEFGWFFGRMKLARREGSFLFIHAGFDDRVAALIAKQGLGKLNRLYKQQIHNDLFEFYYGPVANTLRTKYRKVDMPLTRKGVKKMRRIGIHAVVHGHRNLVGGQRIVLRQGMPHIESDITMDRSSRIKEGLDGYGIGVTIVRPEGAVLGISTDFPYVKVFRPDDLLKRESGGSG